jgi:hypothetical protein
VKESKEKKYLVHLGDQIEAASKEAAVVLRKSADLLQSSRILAQEIKWLSAKRAVTTEPN